MKTLFGLLISIVLSISISTAQCNSSVSVLANSSINERIVKPFPVQSQYVREADVMWSKRIWRVIDLKEKFNHPLYYPENPSNNLRSLFDVFVCGILNDTLKAFANPIFDDEFTFPMTKSDVEKLLVQWDSTYETEDAENPGTYIKTPLKTEITSSIICQYWIKEDWFFDKQRSVMDFKIVGICPVAQKISESGEVIGVKPLFWIYFPDARKYLVKSAVYNRWNDAAQMSFDELFTKRMFSSYIYKESNVYDRTIAQYKLGLDALLESEKIKENIFEYESDLWHY